LCWAWWEAATLIQASCSLVVRTHHVAHCAHRVHVRGGGAVRVFELGVGSAAGGGARRGPGRLPFAARTAGKSDQRDTALAGGNRLGGVADMDDVGRAAAIGRIHVAQFEAHIVGHRQRPETGGIAGAEIAVDIGPRQPGIVERALGRLGMELGERFVVRLARRVLIDPGDIGLTLDAHRRLILPFEAKAQPGDGIPFGA
jgi:hypothetical protein